MPTLQGESGSALVIGGGIAGVKAALALCDAKLNVNSVERTLCMGIHTQRLLRMLSDHNFVKIKGWKR
jgi:heterodisulfide reductase subunit A-like polyferredoxin